MGAHVAFLSHITECHSRERRVALDVRSPGKGFLQGVRIDPSGGRERLFD